MAAAAPQEELHITLCVLEGAKARLKAIVNRLEELEDSYNAAEYKLDQLVQDVQPCEVRLDSALKRIGLVGGEESRRYATIAQVKEDDANLVGDLIISAATISCLGPITPNIVILCLRVVLQTSFAAYSMYQRMRNYMYACRPRQKSWMANRWSSFRLSLNKTGIIMSHARSWPAH